MRSVDQNVKKIFIPTFRCSNIIIRGNDQKIKNINTVYGEASSNLILQKPVLVDKTEAQLLVHRIVSPHNSSVRILVQ